MNDAAAKLQVPCQCPTGLTRMEVRHAEQVADAYVAVVQTTLGRYNRRTNLTLAAGERTVRRAQDAGHPATLILARLESLGVVG